MRRCTQKHIREEAEVGRIPTTHPSPLTPDDLQGVTASPSGWSPAAGMSTPLAIFSFREA